MAVFYKVEDTWFTQTGAFTMETIARVKPTAKVPSGIHQVFSMRAHGRTMSTTERARSCSISVKLLIKVIFRWVGKPAKLSSLSRMMGK